jgi:hypothetical protein
MPVIDVMRALFDKGVRLEYFAEMLLELYSKKHIDDYLRREFAIEQRGSFAVETPQMFSTFIADKMRYAGLVPTGKYMAHVYKKYIARRSRPIWRKKSRSSHRLDFISMLRT